MNSSIKFTLTVFFTVISTSAVFAQTDSVLLREINSLKQTVNDYQHRFDVLEKQIDDLMWFRRLEDIAHVDKVRITSTPRWKPKDPDDRFASNLNKPLLIYTNNKIFVSLL